MSDTRIPTIPDFNEGDLASIATALRTVKLALEVLGGMRQGESTGAPMVYVQPTEPDPQNNTRLRRGDIWFRTTDDTMRFWTGDLWKQVVV